MTRDSKPFKSVDRMAAAYRLSTPTAGRL
jgi:hypothetical protein